MMMMLLCSFHLSRFFICSFALSFLVSCRKNADIQTKPKRSRPTLLKVVLCPSSDGGGVQRAQLQLPLAGTKATRHPLLLRRPQEWPLGKNFSTGHPPRQGKPVLLPTTCCLIWILSSRIGQRLSNMHLATVFFLSAAGLFPNNDVVECCISTITIA